jgi:hypothetical protein
MGIKIFLTLLICVISALLGIDVHVKNYKGVAIEGTLVFLISIAIVLS